MGSGNVSMSWEGAGRLIDVAHQQHQSLKAIHSFMADNEMFGADMFDRGVLHLFQGDYRSAADSVQEGFDTSMPSTNEIALRLATVRQDLRAADEGSVKVLTELLNRTEAAELPGLFKNLGGLGNLGGAAYHGQHRAPGLDGSLSNGIDTINNGLGVVHHAGQIGDGVQTGDDIDDFVDDHDDDSGGDER